MGQEPTLWTASGRHTLRVTPTAAERNSNQLWGGRVSERGDTTSAPEEVRQLPGQAARFGLLDVEGPGEEIVEGTIAHGHHRAREADDIVGHAEVWCRQAHQQRLRVQPHEVARTIGDWEPGVRGAVRQDHCPSPPAPQELGHLRQLHPAAGSCGHLQAVEEGALLPVRRFGCHHAGHKGAEDRRAAEKQVF